jgi:hypothetical protein
MLEWVPELAKVEVGNNGGMPLWLWFALASDYPSLGTAALSDSCTSRNSNNDFFNLI